ncbi:MAG: C69 family dipeptidase [Xanthomonadales bacterium]|nr:C69 family dipeptidase [Xanthomonadales bacterium]
MDRGGRKRVARRGGALWRGAFTALLALPFSCWAPALCASYAIYVGKNLTVDGSVLIGGSGDEVSSHWLVVVPGAEHPEGATIRVGATADAYMPGELMEIPQAPSTFRYLSMNYSDFEGFPPPLTNGGLNEYGVAARDVWSDSRAELVAMTPNPQRGPQYSDLSRIVMERARSAREAVEIVGALIDEHGYTTYGGNSHLFADAEEGWVLLNFAGGQGLWIAERLGPDEVRVSYPGYIREIPLDFRERDDFMGAEHFVEFAVEQGWWDPDSGEPFDVMAVYGADEARYPRTALERELTEAAPVDLRRMMDAVRDRRLSKDSTGYGQVARLRQRDRGDLHLLWVAPTGSVTAPFVPYRVGVRTIAPQFGQHRYLTKGEASAFLTRDWQIQEATEFAGRLFKRLMYYTCDHPDRFLPEVTEALTAFEDRLAAEQEAVEATANALYAQGQDKLAVDSLTRYSEEAGQAAMRLGHALLASIEARTELLYGLRPPEGGAMSALDYQMISCRGPGDYGPGE